MIDAAYECEVRSAAHLRTELAKDVARRVGHALAYAGGVGAAGKVETHRLGVGRIHHQRAGGACIAEAVAADGQLAGEGLGQVGPRLGAIAIVVDMQVHIERGDAGAGTAPPAPRSRRTHRTLGRMPASA